MTGESTQDTGSADADVTSDEKFIEKIVDTQKIPSPYELQLRKENEKIRKKAEADAEAAKRREAQREETYRSEVSQVEAKWREKAAFAELKAEAQKANIVDTDVLKLMDRSNAKYGDDGELLNAAELIEDLRSKKPHFFTSQTSVPMTAPKAKAPISDGAKDWDRFTPDQKRAELAAMRARLK